MAMLSASSTARNEASAWQPVDTPQMRSTGAPGVARVAALADHFQAAPHRAGGYSDADHVVAVGVDLAAHVTRHDIAGNPKLNFALGTRCKKPLFNAASVLLRHSSKGWLALVGALQHGAQSDAV